jgi:hypothetical protein
MRAGRQGAIQVWSRRRPLDRKRAISVRSILMAKITYIEHNGTEHVVDVPNG